MGNYNFTLDLETENTMSVINRWIEPNSNILEFGPANGRLTKYLSEEKGCRITIVEIDEKAGLDAQKYAVNSFLGEEFGNIEKFHWCATKEKYQYIIFADVLEHLSEPEKVLKCCKELLDENGRILVSIPNIAHNSVIIDLMNGKFQYDRSGLLDRTHIHFFTHNTFCEMVAQCNLYICETVPIYSRVGNNEIKNTFLDVPVEVAKYLRKRTEGSIYQYVFNISKNKENVVLEKNSINALEIEQYEQLETLCYYKTDEDSEYSDDRRIGKCFFENETVSFEINCEDLNDGKFIRWSPMIYNGIVMLKEYKEIAEKNTWELEITNSNADMHMGTTYFFSTEYPFIEFKRNNPNQFQGKIQIVFSIISYRKNSSYYHQIYEVINSGKQQFEFMGLGETQKIVEEQREYIIHLEEDNVELRSYIERKEEDICKQKEYIDHLEKDIKELKDYIKKAHR